MTQEKSNQVSSSMYLLMFAFSISTISLQVLMTNIIDDFGLKGSSQAILPSMFILGGMFAVIFMPFIKGRLTKTFMLSMSSLAMAVTIFCLGFSQAIIVAISFALVLGVFGGWIDSYTNSTIIDIHKTNSRKFVGYLHASFCVAAVAFPLVVHFLMTDFNFSWRGVLYISAVIIILIWIRFFIVAKANKSQLDTQSFEKTLTLIEIKSFLKDRYYLLMVLCYSLYCLSQNGISIWLFHYTKTVHPHIAILASLTLSAFWFAGFFSRVFYHKFKTKPIKLFIVGVSISIVAHVGGILSGNAIIFFISIIIVSLSSSMGFPLLVNETLTRYRGNTTMALTGLHFFGKIGAFIMPLIMGAVAAYNIHIAMMMADVVAAISVIIALIILFTKDKRLVSALPVALSK
jgi:MFS family permease